MNQQTTTESNNRRKGKTTAAVPKQQPAFYRINRTKDGWYYFRLTWPERDESANGYLLVSPRFSSLPDLEATLFALAKLNGLKLQRLVGG